MILPRFARALGLAALLVAFAPAQAAQQPVRTGAQPDNAPSAFTLLNANDQELYASTASLQAQLAALQAVSGRLTALQAGTIDGVVIGGTTPAAASFTTLNVSSGITGALNGNAATATLAAAATKLATARTIALSGDASCSFAFDGTANAGCALVLPASGATAGTYGSASQIPVLTVDAKGRVTGVSTVTNGGASGSVSGSRQILTSGLATGGGDLSADRTITVPSAAQSDVATGTDTTKALTSFSVAAAFSGKAAKGANTDITSLASPALGAATATTPAAADSTTKVPTTAFLTGSVVRSDLTQTLGGTGQAQALANLGVSTVGQFSFRNRLRNSNFAINQRGVSGTVSSAAGIYGFDGWKGGSGGSTYTFSTSGLEAVVAEYYAAAGTLLQVVDGAKLEGGAYIFSWSGTATCRAYQGTATGSYVASPIAITGYTAGTNATVECSTGTLTRAQFEPGTVPTAYERRDPAVERAICNWYFQRVTLNVGIWSGDGATNNIPFAFQQMRGAPGATFGQTGQSGNTGGYPSVTVTGVNSGTFNLTASSTTGSRVSGSGIVSLTAEQ